MVVAPDSAGSSWSRIATAEAVEGPALRTESVKVTGSPATGVVGSIVLVMDTSADGAVVAVAVPELLPLLGSAVGDSTVAVLEMSPVAAGSSVAVSVMVAVPPEATVPRAQVTRLVGLMVHVPLVLVAVAPVNTGSSWSITVVARLPKARRCARSAGRSPAVRGPAGSG